MRKINILLLSLTVLSLMNVNYYKNNDNKQLEETTNDTNLVEARKLNDSTSNEEVKISNILKVQYTDEEDGTKSLRFVAGISTLSLDAYFVREEIKTNDNKINMPKKEIQVTSAYTGIQNGNKVSKPSEIFGEEYNYVVAYTLKNIPEEYWFTEINVSLVVNNEISTYRKANVTGAINNYSGILVFSDNHQAVGLDSAVKDTIETVNIPAYYYNITNDEHNLIANENDRTQVLEVGIWIPYSYKGFTSETLKKVNISFGITQINSNVFSGCHNLIDVMLPSSIIKIGDCAFQNCYKLTNIFIPNSVVSIGKCAFESCSRLENLFISKNVDIIGYHAFNIYDKTIYCETTKKPSNWNYEWAYKTKIINWGCKIEVNNNFVCLINDNEASLIKYYGNKLDLIVPSSINGYIITNIGKKAFYFGNFNKIILPDTITNIEEYAFHHCEKLIYVELPNNLATIKQGLFADCISIKTINLPDSVKTIESGAFVFCNSLVDIKLSNNITSIGTSAFNSCKSLKEVTIPDSIDVISDYLFNGCTSLININLPNTITNIGENAFYNCTSLEKITLPNNIKLIEKNAFSYCTSLKIINIPNSVEKIGETAFSYCRNIESIIIPYNTIISYRAFYGWNENQTIYFRRGSANSTWELMWSDGCSAKKIWGYKD